MPTLEFTMMVGCPLKCTFCPQDALREQYEDRAKYFSVANFKTIVGKIPDHVRIDFSGMAEPWANPHATEMLRHALEVGRSVAIYTTLYGMSDPEVVADLLVRHRHQVEVFCLHLPDANGNMRGWKMTDEWMRAHDAIMPIRRFMPRFEVMTMDGGGRVHPSLGGMLIDAWAGHTRAGNVTSEDVGGQALHGRPRHDTAVCCSFTVFYDQNVVLPNGDVVLCCMDYSLKHRLGNLLEQDYYDVFTGLGSLMAENVRPGYSDKSLCKSCDRAQPWTVGEGKQFWRS